MSFLPGLVASIAPTLLGGVINGAQNMAMGALNAQDEAFQTAQYAEQIRHQEQLSMQSSLFDEMIDQRSENMREVNTLRDVEMQQRKADDTITKKFIESIGQ